jgi:hypothetical protein
MQFTAKNTIALVLFITGVLCTGIWTLFFPESVRRLALKRASKQPWITRLKSVPYFGSNQLRIQWLESSAYLWQLRFIGFVCFVLVAFILYVVIHSNH